MGKGNKQRGNREAKKPKADKKLAPVSSTFLRPQADAPKPGTLGPAGVAQEQQLQLPGRTQVSRAATLRCRVIAGHSDLSARRSANCISPRRRRRAGGPLRHTASWP